MHYSSNTNDGIFFMELSDFKRFFKNVQICYYKDNFKYSYGEFGFINEKYYIIEFDITEHDENRTYFISVI